MFVPSLKRFTFDKETNNYVKRFIFNDKVYDIHVPIGEWNPTNRKKIDRFLKGDDIFSTEIPCNSYITSIDYDPSKVDHCEYCNQKFKTFRNKKRHMEHCKLKDITNIRTYNDNSTTNNSTTNDNSVTNNIHIHCSTTQPLRDFGKENSQWLNENVLRQLILPKMEAIQRMFASRHFNQDFPENQNIRVYQENSVEDYVQIRKNGKWRLRKTHDLLLSMSVDLAEIITAVLSGDLLEVFDEHSQEVLESFRKSDVYTKFQKRLQDTWGGTTNLFNDVKREKLMKIIEFLLFDKNLYDKQAQDDKDSTKQG